MRDAWKRSSRFSFLSPDRGGLITHLPFCVLRREPEPRAERLARRADRTRTGPTRTPLAIDLGAEPRTGRDARSGAAGTGAGVKNRRKRQARPRDRTGGRARSRPLRSYEYEHRDATAQLLPIYKHSILLRRKGRCERRRLRGALLWAPPRITPRTHLWPVALRHSLAALHTSKGLTRLTMPRPHHRGQ